MESKHLELNIHPPLRPKGAAKFGPIPALSYAPDHGSILLGSVVPLLLANPSTKAGARRDESLRVLRVTLEYFKATYGTELDKWDRQAAKLLSFLLGYASHLSNTLVHDDLEAGLRATLKARDHSIFEEAGREEPILSAAIGVLLSTDLRQTDQSIFFTKEWFFSSKEFGQIYSKAFGREMPIAWMLERMKTAMGMVYAELYTGYRDQEMVQQIAPTLLEGLNYETFPLGGIRQMVRETMVCWNGILDHVTNPATGGTARPYLCPTLQQGPDPDTSLKTPLLFPQTQEFSESLRKVVEVTSDNPNTPDGYRIRLDPDKVGAPPFRRKEQILERPIGYGEPTFVSTYAIQSHFGTSMRTIELDGEKYLAVGAPGDSPNTAIPQEGSVFYLPYSSLYTGASIMKKMPGDMPSSVKDESSGAPQIPLFGAAQTVWDAHPSIGKLHVVAAPGFAANKPTREVYFGAVSVFKDTKLFARFNGEPCDDLEGRACEQTFAETLTSGKMAMGGIDVLVIGSPRGRTDGDANQGRVDLVWLREKTRIILSNTHPSPRRRTEPNSTFEVSTTNLFTKAAPSFEIGTFPVPVSLPAHSHFGTAIAFSGEHLLVSAPPQIYVFTSFSTTFTPIAGYSFNHSLPHFADFGSKIHTMKGTPFVLIQEPSWKESRGALHIYGISARAATFISTIYAPDAQPGDRFGESLCVVPDGSLRVGSGHAENGRGTVWYVDLDTGAFDSSGLRKLGREIEKRVKRVISGPAVGGRFGSSLICEDVNKDGIPDFVVGMPGRGAANGDGAVVVYLGKEEGFTVDKRDDL